MESAREIAAREETVRLLDPRNILKRGFTITRQNGVILKSADRISDSLPLETLFRDGTVVSIPIKTTYDEHKEDDLPGGDEGNRGDSRED